MAIKRLSFHLGIRGACPCQSLAVGAEEKYLFSPRQEQTAGDGNVRGALQKATGRRGRLGWIKARVQPNKATNIHPARVNTDTGGLQHSDRSLTQPKYELQLAKLKHANTCRIDPTALIPAPVSQLGSYPFAQSTDSLFLRNHLPEQKRRGFFSQLY